MTTVVLASCTGGVPAVPAPGSGTTAPTTATATSAATPGAVSSASTRPAQPCSVLAARAAAAASTVLPRGTAPQAQSDVRCSGGLILSERFAATVAVSNTWDVSVTLTYGTRDDCDRAAHSTIGRCLPINHRPGTFGGRAFCSSAACDQAWVFVAGVVVVVVISSSVGVPTGWTGSFGLPDSQHIALTVLDATAG